MGAPQLYDTGMQRHSVLHLMARDELKGNARALPGRSRFFEEIDDFCPSSEAYFTMDEPKKEGDEGIIVWQMTPCKAQGGLSPCRERSVLKGILYPQKIIP